MTRFLGLVFALLLLSAPAWAQETCTSTKSDDVSSVADAASWTGTPCTPSADDNFIVASGHIITQSGNFLGTTGSLTIQPGGRWVVNAGQTLNMPDGEVNVDGDLSDPENNGVLELAGAKLSTCRIKSPVNYNAAGDYRIDVDCDTTGFTTNDFVIVADEDPSSLTAPLTGGVQYGPGFSGSKVNRPSYDKWRWYPIAAVVDGDTLDLEPDHTPAAVVGTPYVGQYGVVPAGTITTATFTRGYGGTYTIIAIDEATEGGTVCGPGGPADGDLGSYYVSFPDTFPGAATSSCSGLHAKILHCDDETAVGTDTLYVAGDLSDCPSGPSDFEITKGIRRGDKILVVRPATLNGDHDADNIGEGALNQSGGTVNGQFFRIYKPGFVSKTQLTPTFTRHCNWCIHQGEGVTAAIPVVNARWFEVAEPEYSTSDTAVIYAVGANNDTPPIARYPGTLASFDRVNLERGYIHDQRNNVAGGGNHGVYVDTAANWKVNRMRVERMADDGVGGGHIDADGIWSTKTAWRHFLVTENIASTFNSQEGLELVSRITLASPEQYEDAAGLWDVSDIMVVGSYNSGLVVTGVGSTVSSVVVGGAFNAPSYSVGVAGSGAPTNIYGRYPPKLDNSYIFLGNGGANLQPFIPGIIDNSYIVFGFPGNAANRIWHTNQAFRSMFLAPGTHRFEMISGSGVSQDVGDVTAIDIQDIIAVGPSLGAILWNYANADGYTYNQLRTFLAGDNLANPGAVGSAAGSHSTDLRGPVNGFVMTEAGGANSFDGEPSTGQTLTNVCIPSTVGDLNVTFNGQQTTTTRVTGTDDAGPQADIDAPLRAFLQVEGSTDPCNLGRPLTAGLSKFSVTHGLMGDFVIRGYENFTSEDLITPVFSGGGGSGSGGGGPSAF